LLVSVIDEEVSLRQVFDPNRNLLSEAVVLVASRSSPATEEAVAPAAVMELDAPPLMRGFPPPLPVDFSSGSSG